MDTLVVSNLFIQIFYPVRFLQMDALLLLYLLIYKAFFENEILKTSYLFLYYNIIVELYHFSFPRLFKRKRKGKKK